VGAVQSALALLVAFSPFWGADSVAAFFLCSSGCFSLVT